MHRDGSGCRVFCGIAEVDIFAYAYAIFKKESVLLSILLQVIVKKL